VLYGLSAKSISLILTHSSLDSAHIAATETPFPEVFGGLLLVLGTGRHVKACTGKPFRTAR